VIQICLWYVDSGCSKHMTGNLKLLINFVWKFMGTVRFGNDHVAAILGKFCDSDLEVAFRRNACFVRNLKRVDLLKGDRKSKRASHPPKPVPNSRQRLHLLHIDLCGPMRIASINGKWVLTLDKSSIPLKSRFTVRKDKSVIYTVNGLDSRFATLVEISLHQETLPTFETTRTILLLKESSFTDDSGATTTFDSSSSSLAILMTSTSSSTNGNTNKPSTISQICNRAGLSLYRNPNHGNNSSLAGIWNTSSSAPPHYRPANPQNQPRPPTNYHPSPIAYYTSPSLTPYQAQPQVAHYQQPATPIHQ
nr:hybrid signal transduction histidine kinase M [Tanacetum cinerariifolium]